MRNATEDGGFWGKKKEKKEENIANVQIHAFKFHTALTLFVAICKEVKPTAVLELATNQPYRAEQDEVDCKLRS